jgi:hypothetical protein
MWPVQYGFRIKHNNHGFVESHGGWEFYAHVRAGGSRALYRRQALLRSAQMYRRLHAAGAAPEELCGAGLLTIQRAAFCAEDLGGLLHATAAKSDRWKRLTSANIADLDAVYTQIRCDALPGPIRVRARTSCSSFCIGPDDLIRTDEKLSEEQVAAATELAELSAIYWVKRMWPVAVFWERSRELAKATMHGYPMLAGGRVVGPPPAGAIADYVADPGVPFAVALSTHEPRRGHLETLTMVVPCDPPTIEAAHRAGRHAVHVYGELCAQQSNSIERSAEVIIPGGLAYRLSPDRRAAFEALSAR